MNIINQLESEKTHSAKDDLERAIETGYNAGIDRCINVLKAQKVIKSKAYRNAKKKFMVIQELPIVSDKTEIDIEIIIP